MGGSDAEQNWPVETHADLGVFDAFDVFSIPLGAPDLAANREVLKAKKEGKLFLASLGIPWVGTTTAAMTENLYAYLEAPFRKKPPWHEQGLEFDGIELDELTEVFADVVDDRPNNKIDVLREALKRFKSAYPDKYVAVWGMRRYSEDYHRVFSEVVSKYADFYLPEIYIHDQWLASVESIISSSLSSFKAYDLKYGDNLSSKIIIGLGFYDVPYASMNRLPHKDFKIAMEQQFWTIQNHKYRVSDTMDSDWQKYGLAVFYVNFLDQDDIKWLVRLIRHYIIESKTAWIGDGAPGVYPDLPLQNPSFNDAASVSAEAFKWKYRTGSGGRVQVYSNERAGIAVPAFASRQSMKVPQPLRSEPAEAPPVHARVLLMVRGETAGAVWQRIAVDPGRAYLLEAYAKYKDNAAAVVPSDVLIKDGDIISYQKILTPIEVFDGGGAGRKTTYYWTRFEIVYKTRQQSVEVVLTDEKAKVPDAILWDYIQARPVGREN